MFIWLAMSVEVLHVACWPWKTARNSLEHFDYAVSLKGLKVFPQQLTLCLNEERARTHALVRRDRVGKKITHYIRLAPGMIKNVRKTEGFLEQLLDQIFQAREEWNVELALSRNGRRQQSPAPQSPAPLLPVSSKIRPLSFQSELQ